MALVSLLGTLVRRSQADHHSCLLCKKIIVDEGWIHSFIHSLVHSLKKKQEWILKGEQRIEEGGAGEMKSE